MPFTVVRKRSNFHAFWIYFFRYFKFIKCWIIAHWNDKRGLKLPKIKTFATHISKMLFYVDFFILRLLTPSFSLSRALR